MEQHKLISQFASMMTAHESDMDALKDQVKIHICKLKYKSTVLRNHRFSDDICKSSLPRTSRTQFRSRS